MIAFLATGADADRPGAALPVPVIIFALLVGAGAVQEAAAQEVVSSPSFYDPAGADGVIGTADDDYRPDKTAGSPLIDAVAAAGPSDAFDIDGDGNAGEVTPGPFARVDRDNGRRADRGHVESSGSALPVELTSLRAATSDGAVTLRWTTASERMNAGFRVQRRRPPEVDGASGAWSDRAFVDGHGTTSEAHTYRWFDEVPFETDRLQYRLVQVDTDGTTTPSDPVTVRRSPPSGLALRPPAPNPVRSTARIRYAVPPSGERADATLVVFDQLGRHLQSKSVPGAAGRHAVTLDVHRWSSGTYFVRLDTGAGTKTVRLTVVR